jgi:nitrogen regulatory protein PII
MKMVMVIFRQSLEEDILRLLEELHVQAFTESPKVFGVGQAGGAFASFDWPSHNCMIFSALPDDQAERVVERLKAFHDRLSQGQHGAKVPMRVFLLPCDQVV